MSKPSRKLPLASFVFALFLAPTLAAQTPSPNADILKMIQAGLPESVIINKIRANIAALDTSADALIVLKKAGATEAELAVMTAAPPTQPLPVERVVPSGNRVSFMNGTLAYRGGRVTLFMPGTPIGQFDDHSNLLFQLVVVDGQPALRLSVRADVIKATTMQTYTTYGDMLFTHTGVAYYPYARAKWDDYPCACMDKDAKADTTLTQANFTQSDLRQRRRKMDAWVRLSKDSPYDFDFGDAYRLEKKTTLASRVFLDKLFDDFENTMAKILNAAQITDPNLQLDSESHFHPPNPDELVSRVIAINQEIGDRRAKNPAETSGFGMFAQVLSAGATALQQSQAGGNTIAAQQAAMAQYNQNVATIESGGTPNLTPTPTATPQDALNHQLANIKASTPPAAGASGSSSPKNFTFNGNLPNGDIRKSTTTGVQGAYTITIQCFTHNGSAPYFTYSRSGPSEFFSGLPPCSGSPTVASAPAPPPPSNTVAPPVPYQKPPSTGGTVVASGTVCPASGYIFTSYGDAATGVPCKPGQPIAGGTVSSTTPTAITTTAASGFQSVSPVFNCIAQSYVHDDLTFTNNCNVPLYVTWWIGGHSGGWTIDPGTSNGTGYTGADVAAGGGDTFYVCPKGASPVDGSGHVLTSAASNYTCKF